MAGPNQAPRIDRQALHLVATAVERDALLGGVHLVLVRQALEDSATGRCSAGAGLLRQQVVVERPLVQRAGMGDAAVLVGRHHRGAGLGVEGAAVGVRRELRCVLGTALITRSVHSAACTGGGIQEAMEAKGCEAGGRAAPGKRPRCLSCHGCEWLVVVMSINGDQPNGCHRLAFAVETIETTAAG